MKLDLKDYPCKWCEQKHDTFRCASCSLYTCRDCFQGYVEEGCVHTKKEIITNQSWESIKIPEGHEIYGIQQDRKGMIVGFYHRPKQDRPSPTIELYLTEVKNEPYRL